MSIVSSSTSLMVVLYRMTLTPNIKIQKLSVEQQAITPVIGRVVWLLKKLTNAEVNEPIPICIAPKSAEALPAFLLKGAIESAEELGKVKPWQLRKIKMSKIVPPRPIQPFSEATNRPIPVML